MRRLLIRLEAGGPLSQRSLARDLGIALGLANSLLRRTVRNGWVQVMKAEPNSVRYLITPDGVAQEVAMSRAHFHGAIASYAEVRERIRAAFALLSSQWTWQGGLASEERRKEVVFFGAGEVAEVGFVSLQDSDLELVGVIDEDCSRPFFGIPMHPPEWLRSQEFRANPLGRVIVMSFEPTDGIREKLASFGVPPDRVRFL